MPIFEFSCNTCKDIQTHVVRYEESLTLPCAACNTTLTKLMSMPGMVNVPGRQGASITVGDAQPVTEYIHTAPLAVDEDTRERAARDNAAAKALKFRGGN